MSEHNTISDTVEHKQRLTNLAAAMLGEIGKQVRDIEDLRAVVRIMTAACNQSVV